jgi:hypothetical protein
MKSKIICILLTTLSIVSISLLPASPVKAEGLENNINPLQSTITVDQLYGTQAQLEGQLEGIGLYVMSLSMTGQVVPDYIFNIWEGIFEKWQATQKYFKLGAAVNQPSNTLCQLDGTLEGLGFLMMYCEMEGQAVPEYILSFLQTIRAEWQAVSALN